MNYKKILSILVIATLVLSLVACTQQGKRDGKTEANGDAPTTTLAEEPTAETEDTENTEEQAAAPELEGEGNLGQCFITPERTKYPYEEVPPKAPEDITKDDRDNGYVVDYLMGVTYHLPQAWRDLSENSVMVETFGNDRFDGEPVYAGKAYFYLPPALAIQYDDLARYDMDDAELKEVRARLDQQRAPLFTLVLYRNDKLRENLTAIGDEYDSDFPQREAIKAHGDLTLVMGMAPFEEGIVGDMFLPDYESLFEGVKSIYESLNTFTPESYIDTVKNRVQLDFKTQTLQGDKASQKDLLKQKQNLILVWDSRSAVSVQAFNELHSLAAKDELGKLGVGSILINRSTATLTEEERANLLRNYGESRIPILLKDPSMQENFTRFISRYPLYLVTDHKGDILDVHSGYLKVEELKEFLNH